MANNSITSANSALVLGVNSLFPVPQQMQGFAADDAYSVEGVDNAEVVLGVDGVVSSGWIPQIKVMSIMLQADSPGNDFFEAWYAAEEAQKEVLKAFGVLSQPSVGRTYTLTNGVLSGFAPFADGKKVLAARKFQIKWNTIIGAPI